MYRIAEEVYLEINERVKEKQKQNPLLTHDEAVQLSIRELLAEGRDNGSKK